MFFLNNDLLNTTNDLNLVPDDNFQSFVTECNSLGNDLLDTLNPSDSELDFHNNINSKYYHISQFNKIITNSNSTLGICHTNIASLSLHIDDLRIVLSQLKKELHIIGISEHKIKKGIDPVVNLDIEGYNPFIFDPTETTHGGTGFYVSNSINYKKRDDLKQTSKTDFESTFIEVILPNRKNLILGCIYRHPSSTMSIKDFNENFLEVVFNKISREGKLCSIMGDFNLDLLKIETDNGINDFYNTLTSNFFCLILCNQQDLLQSH